MKACKQDYSVLSIVLTIIALTMLPGCFYDNPYNHVRWSSPEASYSLVRTDAYARSDGEPVAWEQSAHPWIRLALSDWRVRHLSTI